MMSRIVARRFTNQSNPSTLVNSQVLQSVCNERAASPFEPLPR
jgi:hypothetical protein